jgi:hypothetical protein
VDRTTLAEIARIAAGALLEAACGEAPWATPTRAGLAAVLEVLSGRDAYTSRARLLLTTEPEVLDDLVAAGWLAYWPTDLEPDRHYEGGPAYTLTPLAADRLGFELEEVGPAERPRWVRRDPSRESAHVRAKRQARFIELVRPERYVDPISVGQVYEDEAPKPATHLWNEWLDEPLKVMGMVVPRDRRIAPAKTS